MTSIHDVARRAGVSTATVSRALRGMPSVAEGTRALIQSCAEELGYVVSSNASGLASGRTLAMDVVVPSVSTWFYTTVLEGADARLRAADYDMNLFNLGDMDADRRRVFSRSIHRKMGDALLALCIDFTAGERAALQAMGIPIMIVGGPVPGLRHVGIDDVDVARRATDHLIGLGHRDIVHLGGSNERSVGLNPAVPRRRHDGYRRALRTSGIALDPRNHLLGEFSTDYSRELMGGLLTARGVPPTAVFADSDEMAIGAILAIQDHGLSVPGEVSVIGIDDHAFAASFGLTTMAQDPFAQGALGAQVLLDDLAGRTSARRTWTLPVPLLDRGSTAPPREVRVRSSPGG